MSIKLMSDAWERTDLTAIEKLVLLSLCDHANDDGICFPSVGRMEQRCSASERSIQRAIQTLEQKGAVKRVFRSGKSTTYQINPRQADTPVTVTPPPHRHPTPVTVTPPGVPRWHPEPSVEPSVTRERRTAPAKAGTRCPPDFRPRQETLAWARVRRPDLDLDSTLEAFRDWWCSVPGARGVKLDWDATFRTWCRREDAPKRANGGNGHWRSSEAATLAKAREIGIVPRGGESWDQLRGRIEAAITERMH